MADEEVVEAELPLDNASARLKRAREARGLSLAQISAQTRIPERHLAAIEQGNFSALPARTYAVGFSRSYAKAVGLDDTAIANAVRGELAEQYVEPVRRPPSFEPGDPARVPPRRLAWLAALAALVLVVAGLIYWRSYFLPGGELPSILSEETAAPQQADVAAAPAAPTPGPVVFTALADGVWVKFYDGAGTQLMQKQMAKGESWTVPDNVPGVKLWTARPEALAITIGGQAVAPLSEVQQTMKDVPVDAASLRARGAAPAAAPVSVGAASPAPLASETAARPAGTVRQTTTRSAPPSSQPEPGRSATPQPSRSAAPVAPAPASAEPDPGAATIEL